MLLKYLPRIVALFLMVYMIFGASKVLTFAVETEEDQTVMEAEVEESTEEVTEETELEIDEIPDDLYQAYVLGCLFFFVIVIVFYFSYKLFAMFF